MKKTLKVSAAIIALFAALAWAGQSDYEDMMVAKMKNNGQYERLSGMYPDASDGELVKIYEAMK